MSGPLRIGLPKGRLFDEARVLFEAAGFDLSSILTDKRRLVHPLELDGIGPTEVLSLRGSDVAAYVEHGVCAIGVCGLDVLEEQRPSVFIPLDLRLGRCRMCVAGLPDQDPLNLPVPRVATKYPRIARDFFLSRGSPAEIIPLSGAIEIAPLVGLADGIVDIVQTGETLRENGLVIHTEMFEVSARLIVNRAALRLRMREIRRVESSLERVLEHNTKEVSA